MNSPVPDDLTALARAVDRLREQNERLTDRVTTLKSELQDTRNRVETLETENETLQDETERLRDRIDDCETSTDRLEAATDAAHRRSGANKARIEELQSRELEKGAHLRVDNVDRYEIEITTPHLERLTKDDGHAYYRLLASEDPLGRSDTVTLAHGDLLLIQ